MTHVPAALAPVPRPSLRAGWIAVAIFTVLYVAAFLDRQVINLLVDDIRRDLSLSDVQISLLQGMAFVVSFALCGLPVGWAIDRYPRRWIVFVGVVVWSLAAAGAGLARSYGQLLGARLGVGAGESVLQPAAYSIFAEIFPKERLSAPMGVFSAGAIVGMGVSLALGGAIVGWARAHGAVDLAFLGVLQPWQLVMLITGAPGLLLSGLAFLITEPVRTVPRLKAETGDGLLAQLVRHRTFYACHFVGFSAFNVVAQGWNSWAPSLLARTLGWEIPRIGATLGLLTITGALTGQFIVAALADGLFSRGVRDAHLRIYVVVGLVAAVAGPTMVAAAGAGSIWLMYGAIIVIQGTIAFLAVAAAALQIVTPTHLRGRMSTLFLLVYNIAGYGLGPLTVAAFTQYLFHDSRKLGLALACNFATFGLLTAAVLLVGLKAYRRAVDSIAPLARQEG